MFLFHTRIFSASIFFVEKRKSYMTLHLLISLIKDTIIFLMTFYASSKIANLPAISRKRLVVPIAFSILIALEAQFLKVYCPKISYYLPALTLCLCACIIYAPSFEIIFKSLFSFCINSLVFYFVSFVVCAFMIIIF